MTVFFKKLQPFASTSKKSSVMTSLQASASSFKKEGQTYANNLARMRKMRTQLTNLSVCFGLLAKLATCACSLAMVTPVDWIHSATNGMLIF